MRIRIVIVMMILAFALQTGYAREYDLDGFIAAVRRNSKALRLASRELDNAREQKREARAGALPRVGVEAGYTRNLSDYYMYFDLSSLMGGPPMVSQVPFKRGNEFSAMIGLDQTLFSATVLYAVKASRQYQALVDQVFRANERALVNGARKLFFQAILLDRVVEVARNSEENALAGYRDVKQKYEQGQVSEFELLRAETRWRAAIPETRQAERNLDLLKNNLKKLAGIQQQEPLKLNGTLDAVPALPQKVTLEQALSARPDFQALLKQEKLAETGIQAVRGSYFPVVKGRAAFAYSAQSDAFRLEEENRLWLVGIQLSVPLYTGGYRRAQVNKAKIEREKVRIRIEQMRDDLDTELSDLFLKLDEAWQRMHSARSTLKVAEKAFMIAEATTRNGLTTQLDLKDARAAMDQALLGFYKAGYDYLEACFDWEYAVGKPMHASSTSR